MIRKKPCEQEALSSWQNDYCRDHAVRGHSNHCYAWLDNGVCPQMMVTGKCSFLHHYPDTWKEGMKERHSLLVKYMEDLYQGCDILDLVGKGKKSSGLSPLKISSSSADLLAEAICQKIDRLDKDKDVMLKANSIADFRFCYQVQDAAQLPSLDSSMTVGDDSDTDQINQSIEF